MLVDAKKALLVVSWILTSIAAGEAAAEAPTHFHPTADADYDAVHQALLVRCQNVYPGATLNLESLLTRWKARNAQAISEFRQANRRLYAQVAQDLDSVHTTLRSPEERAVQYTNILVAKVQELPESELKEVCAGHFSRKMPVTEVIFDFDGHLKQLKFYDAAKALGEAMKRCYEEAEQSPAGRVIHAKLPALALPHPATTTEVMASRLPDALRQPTSDYFSGIQLCIQTAIGEAKDDVPTTFTSPIQEQLQTQNEVVSKLVAGDITLNDAQATITQLRERAAKKAMELFSTALRNALAGYSCAMEDCR